MKTTSIIFAAVLFFQVNFLFAGNDESSSSGNNGAGLCPICLLVPVAPALATFEEGINESAFTFDFSIFSPVTPVEADFTDVVPEQNAELTILAPVTPAAADFNDNFENQVTDLSILAPATPCEANFDQP